MKRDPLQLDALTERQRLNATPVESLAQSKRPTQVTYLRLEPHVITMIDQLCERFGWTRGRAIREAIEVIYSLYVESDG
ncbi:MAG: hypothetical protein IT209_00645 [Armatimonadetes bacterium]|nr:hypothetical protein [Armatimonadota bacterium]